MEPIKVMVSGLPGNMATKAAEHIGGDSTMKLLPMPSAVQRLQQVKPKLALRVYG